MIVYGVWSIVLAAMAFLRNPDAPPPRDTHWGDMLFCAYLVTLTQGTNSLFFSFFLFAILSASFSRGFNEGMMVTFSSVFLFVLASLWFEPTARFALDQTLVRPIYLLTLGYMISYWGGHEITQRRRLRILQEINKHLDPRIGYQNAIKINLDKILKFYNASNCLLVIKRPTTPPVYQTYFATLKNADKAGNKDLTSLNPHGQVLNTPNPYNDTIATKLLDLPPRFSACFNLYPRWWKKFIPGSCVYPVDSAIHKQLKDMAHMIDTTCYLSVPYSQQDGATGRLYLTPKEHPFRQSDVEFVSQLSLTLSHIIESMQLLDELVSESAKHERFKISLDIHDTTIQPYIGLKLGLDALSRHAGTENPLSKDIDDLLNMTDATIKDLRHYVKMLRENKALAGDTLLASIKDQTNQFKRIYGIDVKVTSESEIRVNAEIASAVMQIISEGLSNILRHTQSKNAFLAIDCDDENLSLEIGNEIFSTTTVNFTPRSIRARTLSFGGNIDVKTNRHGYTVVYVLIPLNRNIPLL